MAPAVLIAIGGLQLRPFFFMKTPSPPLPPTTSAALDSRRMATPFAFAKTSLGMR